MRNRRLMIKAGIALPLILYSIVTSYHLDIYAMDAPLFCPLPAAEADTVIVRWLVNAGFETTRKHSESGPSAINAVKGNEEWRIIIRPYSPLASYVAAEHTIDGMPETQRTSGLYKFLDTLNRRVSENVPETVLNLKEHTVCIKAGTGEEHIQFSGFIVGKEGLIISIAHDLDTVQEVTVFLNNGEKLKGRVIRLDFDKDLSLIDIDKEISSPISLEHARNLLEPGETVYSIGCSGDNRSSLHTGVVSGPPGLVNNMPLWQIDMETLHGTSGGPVFDTYGNLVGIVKGRYRGTNSRGFIITVETLIEFLKER
ncbi:MAG: serine protease [Nitrospirota bacterium]